VLRFRFRPIACLLAALLVLSLNSAPAYGDGQGYKNPSREEISQKIEAIAREKGIPSVILKIIAHLESDWCQFDANGNVKTSGGKNPSYGIMQVTYNPAKMDLNRLKYDIDYNIAVAADILNEKFAFAPQIGDGNRNILENWYFALWAYNGWSIANNPNNRQAVGEYSYQDAGFKRLAEGRVPYTEPVRITPIPWDLLPLDTLPSRDVIWTTPEPFHFGDLLTQGKISRISGLNRIDTVSQVALSGWPQGAETVILTRSDDFPDALAGVPLARQYNAPILLTDTRELNAEVVTALQTLKPTRVIILGGEAAVSKTVAEKLPQVLPSSAEIRRIAGADRYETAVLIAGEFPAQDKIALATGANFPDALTLASAAAANGIPLLLVSAKSLPPVTETMLREMKPQEVYVAGGETVVSPEVLEKISQMLALPQDKIIRFAGSDRYDTAVKVAEKFYPAPSGDSAGQGHLSAPVIYLATGRDFADPLAAGALAAVHNSRLLLIAPEGVSPDSPTARYLLAMPLTADYKIVGNGENISETAVEQLRKMLGRAAQ